jgi:hypothetical protein
LAKSIEQRMEDFVAAFGDVPEAAQKLRDYEARQHDVIWIQRLLGDGIVCDYVIGYQLDDEWWTFCFDRKESTSDGEEETWVVERYDSLGASSRECFAYSCPLGLWTREPSVIRAPLSAAWTTKFR